MLEDENTGRLRDAEAELNSLEHKDTQKYSSLEKPEFDVAEDWTKAEGDTNEADINQGTADMSKYFVEKKSPIMKYILIVSFIFFVGAFAFAAMTLWKGSNVSSSDNINVSIIGPSSVDGGEETSLQIVVSNKNTVSLKNVVLYLEFPRSIEVLGENLENQRLLKNIGEIEAGGVANESIKVVFWGEENSKKIINGRIEYQFDGSNAELIKETEYAVDLLSSPIDLTVNMLTEATPGQQIKLDIIVSSEKEESIQDTMVEVDYPNGFVFLESEPDPSFGDNRWELGVLESFRDRNIVIRGTIDGEDTEEKTFHTTVGTQNENDEKIISIPLNKISEKIVLAKPFIGLRFIKDGDEEAFSSFSAVDGGRPIPVKLEWINNDETILTDVEFLVKVDGDFLPGRTLASKGFFRSKDNTAIWDQTTVDGFAVVDGGESGQISLSVVSLPVLSSEGELIVNPQITLAATAEGRRISDVNVPDSTNAPVVKVLRVNTEANLTSRAVRDVGPFQNTGPIPAKANVESTYTILWQITNTANDLEDVVVSAKIPIYMRWMGVYSPKNENLTYDEITGEIMWKIPLIPAGSGVLGNTPAVDVAFQVALTPSLTQVRTTPKILLKTQLTARDGFTETIITDTIKDLTTSITTDPYFDRDNGWVVE